MFKLWADLLLWCPQYLGLGSIESVLYQTQTVFNEFMSCHVWFRIIRHIRCIESFVPSQCQQNIYAYWTREYVLSEQIIALFQACEVIEKLFVKHKQELNGGKDNLTWNTTWVVPVLAVLSDLSKPKKQQGFIIDVSKSGFFSFQQ